MALGVLSKKEWYCDRFRLQVFVLSSHDQDLLPSIFCPIDEPMAVKGAIPWVRSRYVGMAKAPYLRQISHAPGLNGNLIWRC